ncbi:porin family protein [Porphyromonas gulae]|uniref:porin family protein n=1 Tax=Porphyromonas gulae TaxID=111105 RepID=UPI0026F30970|nr:porin family protein [Porphyromonas gulae]
MKKMILAATMLLASIGFANAQNRPTLRVDANFVGSNMTAKEKSISVNGTMLAGLRIGGAAEFALGKDGVYLTPGLAYTMRGMKMESEETLRLHYLQIPVNIGYRIPFGTDMNVSLEAGPYLAYGISGTLSTKGVSGSVNVFDSKGLLNRFDMGLGLSAALGYSRYYFQIGYEAGLLNVAKDAPSGTSLRNNNFYAGFGVRF